MRATVQFDAPNVNGFSWDFRNNRDVPALNFGIDVSNPNNFSFGPQEADGTVHGQFVGRYLHTTNKLKTNAAEPQLRAERQPHPARRPLAQRKNSWPNFEIASGGNGLALPAGVTLASISTPDRRLRQRPGRQRRAEFLGRGRPRQIPGRLQHRMPLRRRAAVRICAAYQVNRGVDEKINAALRHGRLQLRPARHRRCAATSACAAPKRRPPRSP